MIKLTEQQWRVVQGGKPVRVSAAEAGTDCVVLRADVYDRLQTLLHDEGPDERTIARLIEHNMQENDANDPLLESYQ
jgi:hypothetical protein